MITVEQADRIILTELRDYGTELVPFEEALGRVLAQNIVADRDLPPFNRATMDGIAIGFEAFSNGLRTFEIEGTQAAGDTPLDIQNGTECIEIMTGAALSSTVDTVIRYEDVEIAGGKAVVTVNSISKGQNIHLKGKDKKQDDVVASAGQKVTPAIVGLAASVGALELLVKKLPKVLIISSGDELVDVSDTPADYQIRRSNSYTVKAALSRIGLQADILHVPDNPVIIKQQLLYSLQSYDVLLLSGGVSMGKFDYIPKALAELEVTQLFHKVQQRPGKPFWFGTHADGALVFAFPGNPVATFMCMRRYFLPWLNAVLGLPNVKSFYAILSQDISFLQPLTYFLQVKLSFSEDGRMLAIPLEGNGSGDFANLADTDAFMELPAEKNNFKAGEVFRVWQF
ncbi:molybdopterin molybdenumtransferase MoeA [Mucilaginibacter terrenus]|uniref:Molybdopterin molybdenumtransferase n=1 Tax=Mucilaginibacter terrenus TaxID=2482727 RepID=A0A3E2NVV9_9SPHI|nr:molybdopterin molybdotransferase MoeA [Mucilaginibacter terrenus]RFZ84990.1 molybdopterin molybdenumtransferase MoeA [Mucilaginibacter terrenus]